MKESNNPQMDAEAVKAGKELAKLMRDSPGTEPESLDESTFGHGILKGQMDVVAWWKKWYLKAGHKRLGRVLIEQEKALQELIDSQKPRQEAKAS